MSIDDDDFNDDDDAITNDVDDDETPSERPPIMEDIPSVADTARDDIITVRLISNQGGGFAENVKVKKGIKVISVVLKHLEMREDELNKILIRVNNAPVARDYQVKADDRITVTPAKVEGA